MSRLLTCSSTCASSWLATSCCANNWHVYFKTYSCFSGDKSFTFQNTLSMSGWYFDWKIFKNITHDNTAVIQASIALHFSHHPPRTGPGGPGWPCGQRFLREGVSAHRLHTGRRFSEKSPDIPRQGPCLKRAHHFEHAAGAKWQKMAAARMQTDTHQRWYSSSRGCSCRNVRTGSQTNDCGPELVSL